MVGGHFIKHYEPFQNNLMLRRQYAANVIRCEASETEGLHEATKWLITDMECLVVYSSQCRSEVLYFLLMEKTCWKL